MNQIHVDATYALAQLRSMKDVTSLPTTAHDRYAALRTLEDRRQRAIDALERIEVNARGLPDDGDPTGTPAQTDFSCRVVTYAELVNDDDCWLDAKTRKWLKADDQVAVIDSHSTCGPMGRQTFPAVAVVLEFNGPNPGLAVHGLSTVSLTEKLVQYVKTRPWAK